MAENFTKLFSSDNLDKLWHSDKFWRNIVLGAIIAKLSTKVVGAGVQYAIQKFGSSPVPEIKHEKDVVYLHIMPRKVTKGLPSNSPFVMKLETWLRVNNIKFEVIETTRMARKTSQFPFIIFNGEEYADTGLIISFLTKYFKMDESEGLSPEQWAISRAITKMTDEDFIWTYVLPRYVWQIDLYGRFFRYPPNAPNFLWNMTKKNIRSNVSHKLYMQGMGRLSKDQVAEIGKDDLRAISKFLGDKQYMMGSKPTKVDCSVFGHLCQVVYIDFPFVMKELLTTECRNIMPYMERIRKRYWPDWDDIVHTGEFS